MYKSFEELHKAYGFDDFTYLTRDDLSEEQEKAFVNDCYDTYEHIGFADSFKSPYEEFKPYNGKSFTVLGRVDESITDLECLPMWKIRFDDGKEIMSYPEEICLAERK